ncbi:unnamed protein product [Staurois parvus]|uniref:Uncharacterized protein n=1 Tax=Staurois parvus TaxID=386267 RepID=A0ABN9ET94_9NEOB|nr:unnamed protein product [Staurois parvus]
MGGHTATYDKMETSRSVRRPESGTWQSGSNGRRYRDPAAMGGRTGTHERLWTWQQHEEAVYRGPWQIRGLAAAMGGP